MAQDHSNRIADALSSMAAEDAPAALGKATAHVAGEPSASVADAAHSATGHPATASKNRRAQKQLDLKRTAIPILLTCGTLLIVGAATNWAGVLPGVRSEQRALPVLMICGGAVLLAIAAINMLQVRDQLRQQSRPNRSARTSFDA